MTTFRITPQTSILQTAANINAFEDGTAGADRLIVDTGAFLIATGGGAGAVLENSGAWVVSVNGSVSGGLFLDLNNAAVSNVTVGKTGSIDTVILGSAANFSNAGRVETFIALDGRTITNGGSIGTGITIGMANGTVLRNTGDIGDIFGISIQVQQVATSNGMGIVNSGAISGGLGFTIGNDTLSNSGTIGSLQANASMFFFDGDNRVVNTGIVYSGYIGGDDRDDFDNRGEWNASSIGLGNGANTFVNSGFVGDALSLGQILGGSDTDLFVNGGTIGAFVDLGDGSNTLTNRGVIGVLGIEGGNDEDVVTNSGTIYGDVTLQDGANRFINSGSLTKADFAPTGGSYLGGAGVDDVMNRGFIASNVALGNGSNTLRNSGTIAGFVQGGADSDTIVNTKGIGGPVALFNGANALTNSGDIGTDTVTKKSYIGGTGVDLVTNRGTLAATIDLGDGDNSFFNSGVIDGTDTFVVLPLIGRQFVDGDLLAGSGNDTITNSGTIHGAVVLGDGANTLINSGTISGTLTIGGVTGGAGRDTVTNTGRIFSVIDLLGGDDIYKGSKYVDIVFDGDGSDTTDLGGGDDLYTATGNLGADGIDTVDGGAGRDAYGFGAATNGVKINLDTVAHNGVGASRAIGLDIASAAFDIVLNFEDVEGGTGNDEIHGTKLPNLLLGGSGDDEMFGYGGSDTLTGDAGADTFHLTSAQDSGINARDIITDYESGLDKIDLSAIDSDVTNGPVDDAFIFIGTNAVFSGAAGELRTYFSGADQIVEGDINGDGSADFAIVLANTHATVDFVL